LNRGKDKILGKNIKNKMHPEIMGRRLEIKQII